VRAPNRSRRGGVLILVMAVVAAMLAVVAIGQDARVRDLGYEERPRCRLAARLAAESAIQRALARLAEGRDPQFASAALGEGVTYELEADRAKGRWALEGIGHCRRRDGGTSELSIRATVERRNGSWAVVSWDEGPSLR
jgi:hypothetical protein